MYDAVETLWQALTKKNTQQLVEGLRSPLPLSHSRTRSNCAATAARTVHTQVDAGTAGVDTLKR